MEQHQSAKKVANNTKNNDIQPNSIRTETTQSEEHPQHYLYGHFVFGEGSAPQELVYAVDGEESCDVGTEVISNGHSHSMCCDHLWQHKNPLITKSVFIP